MANKKIEAIALLANGIQAEVVTEDQAINILTAMDAASNGTDEQLESRAHALTPIFNSLLQRYGKLRDTV